MEPPEDGPNYCLKHVAAITWNQYKYQHLIGLYLKYVLLWRSNHQLFQLYFNRILRTELRGFSPQAKFTYWATATI
jgi:hypothetical protein